MTYFDIGSRGGFQADLHPVAFAVDVVGFEPNPVEFERLRQRPPAPWKSQTFLPDGISDRAGRQTLYIPRDPQSASLMKHDPTIGEKFDKRQFFDIEKTEEVETVTLQDALAKTPFSAIDYLKIDIEGPELAVFEASGKALDDILAIKTEVSFIPFRLGQPLASDVDTYLKAAGFELMDMIGPANWRRHGYVIHPYCADTTPSYSKGKLVQADFLYFRDPDSLGDDRVRCVKLAMIAMSFGYFDHALMILERPAVAAHLRDAFGCAPIDIVAPASKAYGRRAYLQAFYKQVRGIVPFVRYLKNLFA